MTPSTSARPLSSSVLAWAATALFAAFASLWLSSEAFIVLAGEDPARPRWLTWFRWALYWRSFPEHRMAIGGSAAVGFGLVLGFLGWAAWPADRRKLYGDARWAKRREARKAGLLGAEQGIVVGKWGDDYLVLGGQEPVEVAAATGTGKSQGIAIPNALHWHASFIANDPKEELYLLTAGWRQKHGHAVYRVNLGARNLRTYRWNALAYVDPDPNLRVDDVQNIAHLLVPNSEDPKAQYWIGNARYVFQTLVLYQLETPGEPCTLPRVRELCHSGAGLKHWAKKVVKDRHENGPPLSRIVMQGLMAMAGWEEKYAGEVKETLATQLEVFEDPMVAAATSGNDFDLRQLRRQLMTIYLVYKPAQFEKLKPLIRLFYQQALVLNADKTMEQDPSLKHQVLLLMDEFGAMGSVPQIQKGLAWMRAYGFRLLAIYQSRAQNADNYGERGAEFLRDQFGCTVLFTPPRANNELHREYSTMLHTQTVVRKSRSRRISFFSPDPSHTESESEHARPLMLPEEIANMPLTDQIVLRRGVPPIYCRKIHAEKDPTFSVRMLPAPATPEIAIPEPMPLDVKGFLEQDKKLKPADGEEAPKTSSFTLDDLDRLDKLTLDDFNIDFSHMDMGEPPLSEEAVQHAVDVFFAAVAEE